MTTTTITTDGGAAIQGNVTTGTFIGRDQIIVLGDYTAAQLETVLTRLREALSHPGADLQADLTQSRLTVTAPDTAPITLSEQAAKDLWPVAARQADDRAYLTALRLDPRYGRWAQQFVVLAGILTTQALPPGWADIPPEFIALEVSGEGAQKQIRRVPLDDITQAIERHPALVLLGAPGCGKTTTLQRLALDAAGQRLKGTPSRLPLFLPLAEYRDYRAPYDFLEAKWTQQVGTADLPQRLRQGDLFLLCDALNEMPARDSTDYRARVGAWRQFVQDWPGNHLLFTCRSRDYSEPLGLPQVEIEPLDDGRVREFLQRYLPADLAARTGDRLRATPLLALVRNPYYLYMLTYLVHQGGDWPANRAKLFDGFVNTLLNREQTRQHPDWPGADTLRQALANLAETMQALAFTVSGLTQISQIQRVLDTLVMALEDGKTFVQWQQAALEDLELTKFPKTLLETIFRTNLQSAYESGRWEQFEKSKRDRPYLLFDAIMDARTTQVCRHLDGIIRPVDDPLWEKYAPLNHHNCRSTLLSLDAKQARARTKKDSGLNKEAPTQPPAKGFDGKPRTSRLKAIRQSIRDLGAQCTASAEGFAKKPKAKPIWCDDQGQDYLDLLATALDANGPLPDPQKATDLELLPTGQSQQEALRAFMAEFGAEAIETVLYDSVRGLRLAIDKNPIFEAKRRQ